MNEPDTPIVKASQKRSRLKALYLMERNIIIITDGKAGNHPNKQSMKIKVS